MKRSTKIIFTIIFSLVGMMSFLSMMVVGAWHKEILDAVIYADMAWMIVLIVAMCGLFFANKAEAQAKLLLASAILSVLPACFAILYGRLPLTGLLILLGAGAAILYFIIYYVLGMAQFVGNGIGVFVKKERSYVLCQPLRKAAESARQRRSRKPLPNGKTKIMEFVRSGAHGYISSRFVPELSRRDIPKQYDSVVFLFSGNCGANPGLFKKLRGPGFECAGYVMGDKGTTVSVMLSKRVYPAAKKAIQKLFPGEKLFPAQDNFYELMRRNTFGNIKNVFVSGAPLDTEAHICGCSIAVAGNKKEFSRLNGIMPFVFEIYLSGNEMKDEINRAAERIGCRTEWYEMEGGEVKGPILLAYRSISLNGNISDDLLCFVSAQGVLNGMRAGAYSDRTEAYAAVVDLLAMADAQRLLGDQEKPFDMSDVANQNVRADKVGQMFEQGIKKPVIQDYTGFEHVLSQLYQALENLPVAGVSWHITVGK